jgi:hypothetical protein
VSDTLRNLYHYVVREVVLTLEALQNEGLEWPWPDTSLLNEKDLQIMYYLGSTKREQGGSASGFMDIRAVPFVHLP